MMNARVIFTKEFLDKTKGNNMKSKKQAYAQSAGYFEKLIDLDSTGELAKATSRSGVARLVGFSDKRRGYTWVTNAVRRGRIKEILLGVENGKNIYEYHYGRDALKSGRGVKAIVARPMTTVKEAIEKPTMTIKYGKVEIVLTENAAVEYVVSLVKQLNKE